MTCHVPTTQRGSPSTCVASTTAQPVHMGEWFPKLGQIFTTVPVYLSEPYQKIGFIVLCKRIASSVMATFSNKVILLLPQCTNTTQEQIVVACREPLILKISWFLPVDNFENALNFNRIFCMTVKNTFMYQQEKNWKFFDKFYYFLQFSKMRNTINWEK